MSNKITNIQVMDFLEDFETNSETTVLEEGSKQTNELLNSARKRGIIISKDDRDLGIIKTIYAFTSKSNSNGARLPKADFIKIFPQIIGRPMNYGHNRQMILGFYIDYKYILKEEKAIAYSVFFKSAYPKIWRKVKDFQKKKKLSSSFEIWSDVEKRKHLSDGTYELQDMAIAGGALIFEEYGELPAFKDAKVLSVASEKIKNCIGNKCLVYASKYKEEEIIMANKDIFKKSVEDNVKKLEKEKQTIKKEKVKKPEPKPEPQKQNTQGKEPEKVVPPVPVITKIKCSNCKEELEYNGVDIKIKCSKCLAILNKEGVMQYPPQIKDFKVLCPACKVANWLTLSRSDKEAKLKCLSCSKEYKATFDNPKIDKEKLLDQFSFLYRTRIPCPQCHESIAFSGVSNLKSRTIKCTKCGMTFPFDISYERFKKVTNIEEIKKLNTSKKSTEKGGQKMELKIELSKFHRYVNDFEGLEKSVEAIDDLEKSEKSARLTYEQKQALPDNMFAVVVRVKDKRTGEMRKIRMFPINDKAHVRNALARLGQPALQATLKRLGVSIERVRAKILRRARQLKMTQLLERYKTSSKPKEDIKPEAKKEKIVEPQDKDMEKVLAEAGKEIVELKKNIETVTGGANKKEEIHKAEIKKLTTKIISLQKDLAEANKNVEFYKNNARKILERREKLAEYAKELTDKQILDDEKFEVATLKKKLGDSEQPEVASEGVGDTKKDAGYYKGIQKKVNKSAFGHIEKGKK